jgi:predicted XRE-type DNA-binding protein
MTQKAKRRVTRSSRNVFRDLGFPPEKAEHLLVRADLMIRLEKELGSRGLKQAQAAELLGITQPRVSDLLRGRVELFSADALIDMLPRLGIKVRVVASTRKRIAQSRSPFVGNGARRPSSRALNDGVERRRTLRPPAARARPRRASTGRAP